MQSRVFPWCSCKDVSSMKFQSRYSSIKPRQMEANDEKQARNADNERKEAWIVCFEFPGTEKK